MIWNNSKTSMVQFLVAVLLLTFGLTACGSGTTGDSGAVTPQGTIDLANLKVSVPEKVLEDAVLSFELDENPLSRAGGKTQYLSRTKDARGGSYLAQCRDGSCFGLQALYLENPITKEQAMETVKAMLPSRAPEQSKVDDSNMSNTENPRLLIYYGDEFYAELHCTDSTGEKVKIVSVWDINKMKGVKEEPASDKEGAEKAESSKAEEK